MKRYSTPQYIPSLERLPISWKLTIWSSAFLLFCFIGYNTLQYVVINGWLYNQEVNRVVQTSNEVKAYFKDTDQPFLTELAKSKDFLTTLNHKHQMVRILDENGAALVQISNLIEPEVVKPRAVTHLETGSFHYDSQHLLVVRNPIAVGRFRGTVEISRSMEEFDELNRIIMYLLLVAGIGSVLISGVGGYVISRQLLRPIKMMTETMREIRNKRDEGLALRVNFFANRDEISELASIFNEMMDRLEHSFQQQKQFVEDASHELRTPIAIIEGHLSLLNRWGKEDPVILSESLTMALEETKRLKLIVLELLELSRSEKPTTFSDAQPVNPTPIIEKLVLNMSLLHPEFTITKDLKDSEGLLIRIKPNHLEQILLILLDNAIKYSGQSKTIDMKSERRGNHLVMIIKDYGQGIPPKELPFIFQRFFRANKARNRDSSGIGLGLSIAQRLVTSYHGTISAKSHEGKGTSMILTFPLLV
ncbi:HAMP domain-containing sensor histidine kinase [Brevibacillus ginsengisoli]|uniref:HAMP domain-containing sensor histidine kinase n=1 Tax=Brevibacillus ginsengisoli TaxID=363854 RepID=UPI003CFA69F0